MVDQQHIGPAYCIRHGGTAYMRPMLDEMLAEIQDGGLIKVTWKQKLVGLFLPSEAQQMAKVLLRAVKEYRDEQARQEAEQERLLAEADEPLEPIDDKGDDDMPEEETKVEDATAAVEEEAVEEDELEDEGDPPEEEEEGDEEEDEDEVAASDEPAA